jgi:hypothetical protein
VNTVVAVDTNSVANVSTIKTSVVSADSVVAGSVEFDERLHESSSGLVYLPVENRAVTLAWPTNYVSAYTNYPGGNRDYVDPFVTEWFLNRSLEGLREDLSVFGDKEFFVRYTNSPPNNIQSLLGYVSNCVYLLSNVKVQMSYNTVSNEIEEIKTRVERTEATANRFGAGVTDLDDIINSDIEDMDAENMLEMIKTLALYIKNGTTNTVTVGE